jgi:hypothetical protein
MKKIIALTLASIAVFGLASCGGNNKGLTISKNEAVKKVRQLGENQGFSFSYTYIEAGESSTIEGAQKGNIAYFLKDHDGIALVKSDKYYHVYFNEGKEFEYRVSYQSDVYAQMLSGSMMYLGHDLNVEKYTKGEEKEIAGRNAETYTFEYSAKGTKHKYALYLDKELGFTLGVECLDYEDRENLYLMLKEFKTGADLNGLDLEMPEKIVDAADEAKENEKWKVEVPSKVKYEYVRSYDVKDFSQGRYHVEVLNSDVYGYRLLNGSGIGQLFEKQGSAYKYYFRDYADLEEGWVETPLHKGRSVNDSEDAIACIESAHTAFDLTELIGATYLRKDIYLGYEVDVYKNKEENVLYYAPELKMILKVIYKGNEYLPFIVTYVDFDVDELSDSASSPLDEDPVFF